ncbi:MAG: dTMP kinase [Armatimonadota bacterium]
MTSFFVTIEGVEGAGKSTLADELASLLRTSGREVVVTAEPGGSELGVRIRELVLESKSAISDRAELLLFEAARAQHVDETILPALSRGAIVICDRYADSSLAYQGYARGIDLNTVRTLNDYATSGLKPDLTILLDLPADAGLSRQKKTDRVSSEGLDFHEAVRQGFLALAQAEPERFVVLDARQSIDDIVKQSLEVIEPEVCL